MPAPPKTLSTRCTPRRLPSATISYRTCQYPFPCTTNRETCVYSRSSRHLSQSWQAHRAMVHHVTPHCELLITSRPTALRSTATQKPRLLELLDTSDGTILAWLRCYITGPCDPLWVDTYSTRVCRSTAAYQPWVIRAATVYNDGDVARPPKKESGIYSALYILSTAHRELLMSETKWMEFCHTWRRIIRNTRLEWINILRNCAWFF